jgi:Skp family chaperone for outer membrane proteins
MQSQQTLVSEGVMTQIQRDLDRLTREGQALQQDLKAKEDNLNQDLINAFQTKVMPIMEALRVEKSLWMIMAVDQAPGVVVAANVNLDLSGEVTKRLDAAYPGPCGK